MENNIECLTMQIDMSISLGTIIALIALIVSLYFMFLERKRDIENRKAVTNSLYNELALNIQLSKKIFLNTGETEDEENEKNEEYENFIKDICIRLKMLYGNYVVDEQAKYLPVYQDPSTFSPEDVDTDEMKIFFRNISFKKTTDYLSNRPLIPKYHTYSIEKALSSGIIWNFAGQRISHNLGILRHSINCIDILVERFMESHRKEISIEPFDDFFKKLNLDRGNNFDRMAFHYWHTLHYKLWFLFIDLSLSTDECIIKHFEYEKLRKQIDKIDGIDWDELHDTLSKTRNQNFYPLTQNS